MEVKDGINLKNRPRKNRKITPAEIVELLELRNWNQADLAAELDVGHVTVWRWIEGKNIPPTAAQMLMRQWLDAARRERA